MESGEIRRTAVFGGSGFIGERVVGRLLARTEAADGLVRVASRHASTEALRRSLGKDGRIEAVETSILDDAQVAVAVGGAEAVVNLVGILSERGPQTFEAVHVKGARRVALAAQQAGARRLVHMSALGADAASPSAYARSKAAGERAVREVFPDATIVRPSIVFGPGDHFFARFNAIARFSPALPLIGGGATRFQPVFVEDVAEAFAAMLARPDARGRTYELAGPRTYSFRELMRLMLAQVGRRRLLVPLPFRVAELQGALLERVLPSPPLTRDQVLMLKTDNVAGGGEPGLPELGIRPQSVEEILPTYLRR